MFTSASPRLRRPGDITRPAGNGPKVSALLTHERGSALLYRTVTAGPSGQRAHIPVGRVTYNDGADEFVCTEYEIVIYHPRRGDLHGYARMEIHADHGAVWSITRETWAGDLTWLGYAETLSLGADVCVYGLHAATGRHDSRRLSGGQFWPSKYLAD